MQFDVFTKQRSGYNSIKSFGIVSAENADSIERSRNVDKKQMTSLADSLKSAHYGFVKQKGHFGGNDEYSYFVFNIRLETLMYYAGQYEQTSFFFVRLIDADDGKQVESSYYEKSDKAAPYDKTNNPYVLIERTTEWLGQRDSSDYSELGGRFKYIIPLKCFEEVNAQIEQNKKLFEEKDRETIIDFTMNRVGQTPWNYRGKLYKGLMETSRRQKAQQAIQGTNRRVRTMAIISAENLMGNTMSNEYNQQAREELERLLAIGHYRYFKVKGSYDGIENSVMIYNISIEDTLYLCYRYNQESVIFVDMQNDGEISYQYWQGDDNSSQLKLQHEEHDIIDATDDGNYYTQISKKLKFRIPFFEHIKKINDDLSLRKNSIDVDRLITESLESNRTGKSKYIKRGQLYGKYKPSK